MEIPSLQRPRRDLLVTYSIGSGERIPTAITKAFQATASDPWECETVVNDWIDGDAIDQLCRTSDRHLRVSTIVWNHPVVVTPEEIRIYAEQSDPTSKPISESYCYGSKYGLRRRVAFSP